jgi:type II restriction enzyme
MDLRLSIDRIAGYKSPSQIARILTEDWAKRNAYCPACESRNLLDAPPNTQAIDYFCPKCDAPFQLKARRDPIGGRIPDASFDAMMRAISEDRFPHLFVLRYDLATAAVLDLILIPNFCIPPSAIHARRPLSPTARRAGWIGCDIMLTQIPQEARISVVVSGNIIPSRIVRQRYNSMAPFAGLSSRVRGWTLDVFAALRSLDKNEFGLADAYAFEEVLADKHPYNRNIRPKIRQQLQVLRDLGYIEFIDRGMYRWTNK